MNRCFLSPALLAPVLNLILLSCPLQGQITLRDGWAIRSAKEVNATGEQVSSVTYSPSGWYSTSAPATVLAVLVKHGVYPDPYFGTNLATIPGYNPNEWIRQDMPKDSPSTCRGGTAPNLCCRLLIKERISGFIWTVSTTRRLSG